MITPFYNMLDLSGLLRCIHAYLGNTFGFSRRESCFGLEVLVKYSTAYHKSNCIITIIIQVTLTSEQVFRLQLF